MHITHGLGEEHLNVRTCARADVPPFSYPGNGWTDSTEIPPISQAFCKNKALAWPHVRLHTPFLYLGNGWTDCAEIWLVVRDPLSWYFTKLNGGVLVHLSTYMHVRTPFLYLRNGWTDYSETWCVVRRTLAMRFTRDEGYPHDRT